MAQPNYVVKLNQTKTLEYEIMSRDHKPDFAAYGRKKARV